MKTAIIIQARMGSTRLPKKSLKKLNGTETVKRCYEQCSKSKLVDKVIIAIPIGELDDELYNFCKENDMSVFRGDSVNLAQRYHDCAKEFGINTIIRITGDNPIVDPHILDQVLEEHIKKKGDYTTTRHWDNENKKLTGLYPAGLSIDIFNFESLKRMNSEMSQLKENEKEHIVFFYCNHNDEYKIVEVGPNEKLNFIFTIDTQEQFNDVEKLIIYFEKNNIEYLYENFLKYVPKLFQGSEINTSKEYKA